MVAYLPNLLSVVRLVIGLYVPFAPPDWLLWLVVGAAASDLVDGTLARWLGADGPIGRVLDPVADKVVVVGVLVTLLARGLIAPGELVLLAMRDVAVVSGVVWLLVSGRRAVLARLRPSPLGKLTTAAQFAYVLAVLWWREPLALALAPVAVLSGLAGLDYLRRGLRGTARMDRVPSGRRSAEAAGCQAGLQ
jgi:phosphatidylglycerophosphate synthase